MTEGTLVAVSGGERSGVEGTLGGVAVLIGAAGDGITDGYLC